MMSPFLFILAVSASQAVADLACSDVVTGVSCEDTEARPLCGAYLSESFTFIGGLCMMKKAQCAGEEVTLQYEGVCSNSCQYFCEDTSDEEEVTVSCYGNGEYLCTTEESEEEECWEENAIRRSLSKRCELESLKCRYARLYPDGDINLLHSGRCNQERNPINMIAGGNNNVTTTTTVGDGGNNNVTTNAATTQNERLNDSSYTIWATSRGKGMYNSTYSLVENKERCWLSDKNNNTWGQSLEGVRVKWYSTGSHVWVRLASDQNYKVEGLWYENDTHVWGVGGSRAWSQERHTGKAVSTDESGLVLSKTDGYTTWVYSTDRKTSVAHDGSQAFWERLARLTAGSRLCVAGGVPQATTNQEDVRSCTSRLQQCHEDDKYGPICGTDGITYGSNCILQMERCNGNPVQHLADGVCQSNPMCAFDCGENPAGTCNTSIITSVEAECCLQAKLCRDHQMTHLEGQAGDGEDYAVAVMETLPHRAKPDDYADVDDTNSMSTSQTNATDDDVVVTSTNQTTTADMSTSQTNATADDDVVVTSTSQTNATADDDVTDTKPHRAPKLLANYESSETNNTADDEESDSLKLVHSFIDKISSAATISSSLITVAATFLKTL